MAAKQKMTGRATTIPAGVGLGLVVSIAITILGAALAAYLIAGEMVGENGVGYCSLITLLLASLAGSLMAAARIKRLRVQMCLLSGAVYYLALLAMTALFFGGQFAGMGVNAVVVLLGSGAAALLGLKPKKGNIFRPGKRGYR